MQPVVNLFEYERLAKARMSRMAFDYYASGAMDEITVRATCWSCCAPSLTWRWPCAVATTLARSPPI